MVGKIYRKLYLWFLLVFILTIVIVSIMIHGFYSERVRDEIHGQLESHAEFLLAEYRQACRDRNSEQCAQFLDRLRRISPLRFWILDPDGAVILSNRGHEKPSLKNRELARAQKGEIVVSARNRRMPAYVIVPLRNKRGGVDELALVERGFLNARPWAPFPFFFSLLIMLVTIAILIYPLSKRLTRPVRELHQLALEWADGRLERRATVQGNDEISDLAGTFNSMAENLQKMLQQRKEFLASISHELKSPLARMRIALELLNEKSNAENQNLVEKIEQDISDSEKLIEQLLVLSKIEMNPAPIREPVDFEQATKNAIRQVEPFAKRAGVVLNCSGNATITGDFHQLERALTNILENAIKFSAHGESVIVEITREDGSIVWKCSDHGAGIEAKEQEKIFEPFFRGKQTSGKEGSGLGLFIAKRIVEMHGGRIQALKNQWNGTTIVMQFPDLSA